MLHNKHLTSGYLHEMDYSTSFRQINWLHFPLRQSYGRLKFQKQESQEPVLINDLFLLASVSGNQGLVDLQA